MDDPPQAPAALAPPEASDTASASESLHIEVSALIYRDINLADAKAAFALTVAGLGIAGMASFYGSMPDPASRLVALSSRSVWIPALLGVIFAVVGIFCAIVTVLPRRYVGMDKEINPEIGLWGDARRVFGCNIPFRTGRKTGQQVPDGGTVGIDILISALKPVSGNKRLAALQHEVARCAVVRERKYWWVGPSLFMTFFAVLLFIFSLIAGALVVTAHNSLVQPIEVRLVK
jgi:hypothetical protein